MKNDFGPEEIIKVSDIRSDNTSPILVWGQKIEAARISSLVYNNNMMAQDVELVNELAANKARAARDHYYGRHSALTSPRNPSAAARSSRGQFGAKLMSSSAAAIVSASGLSTGKCQPGV